LAIAAIVGFNYNMISTSVNETGMSLTSLIKNASASDVELDEVTVTTSGDSEVRECSSTDGTWTYCDCETDDYCKSISC
jgi:hypothetical protein